MNKKIEKKKKFGQHFLRKQPVVDHMIDKVQISPNTYVMEIGCGDGFLTQSILQQTKCKELWVYEIDPEWANFVKNKIQDSRLKIFQENILELNFSVLESNKPWVLLANLPYQITFPIFFLLQRNKALFQEGVVMVQEEVAKKITATRGKGYSSTSLFLQYHFEFQLLEKIEPGAFSPPPKVFSRLIYFKPKFDLVQIPNEAEFWRFLKLCFLSPRRTLRNNLITTHCDLKKIPENLLGLRAQQLSFNDFLKIWEKIIQV
ncbi:16S rRNA (adenine(1518)-N(6)/adenine(1519)-N(6))-dimethyltransferase RsmA [Candidatus Babeliales bacterium]|nr:16S rRNA (adenine(1518)-N(6)/adenine(1519)-N(6))-dimethyltransferase RsmA [Candidatus Babeliales bacterium]MCF7899863.1 16S rRNA (adenine(1518)-N(6)/adenine(1519)-N(6))-dimethyltransferase RsmA [Candidatus Babeliales bacterium]